jgi:putative acetyltransferase
MTRALTISRADPASPEASSLLARHAAFTKAASPPGTCFAFDAERLSAPDVSFWLARVDGQPAGCAALKRRADGLAELKSMHVLESARGAGVGRALVNQVIEAAREAGFTRIGLETGRSEGFAASRRLYQRMGFEPCPAFPPYPEDSFSYCMMRTA